MPILANHRHEIFAQGISQGLPQYQAYLNAGYTTGSQVSSSASRLARHASIIKRIKELQASAAEIAVRSVGIDKGWVLQQLHANAVRCMDVDDYKPVPAIRALELIGKELGMFVDRVETLQSISDLRAEDLERLLADVDRRLADRRSIVADVPSVDLVRASQTAVDLSGGDGPPWQGDGVDAPPPTCRLSPQSLVPDLD